MLQKSYCDQLFLFLPTSNLPTNINAKLPFLLESIAASVFVFILIGFDKSEANPNITDGETSRLV